MISSKCNLSINPHLKSISKLALKSLFKGCLKSGASELSDAEEPGGEGEEDEGGDGKDGAGAKEFKEAGLDPGGTCLAKASSDYVDSGFAFGLGFGIKGDIGHLLCSIEEAIFHGFAKDMVESTCQDDETKGGADEVNEKEDPCGNSDNKRGGECRRIPTPFTNKVATHEEVKEEGYNACYPRKDAHKGLVVGRERYCFLRSAFQLTSIIFTQRP